MADAALDIPRMSAKDYLALEKQSPVRHEFVNGLVYAMAGASKRHDAIALAVLTALDARLSPPCQPFSSDVKVHIRSAPDECFYYPDMSITCSDLDKDPYLVKLPTLIVEVLSRTTEDADRGYKFANYRTLPSLQEYVLVHQARPQVELYRRRNNWEKENFEFEAEITLESVGVTLPISAFYRRVGFPPGPAEEM